MFFLHPLLMHLYILRIRELYSIFFCVNNYLGLSIHLSVFIFLFLSIFISTYVAIYLYIYLSTYLLIHICIFKGSDNPILNFCANNYLGLSNHPRVVQVKYNYVSLFWVHKNCYITSSWLVLQFYLPLTSNPPTPPTGGGERGT